jgi:lysophospholipase L1-like esterase
MRFQDGAVVCFVGDSITHTGTYIKHILHTYRTKFPSSNVEFYDAGIAGGTLANTIKVYSEDIEIYNPTNIVLMIGINDSNRELLSEKPTTQRYEKLVKAFEDYKTNMECFYQITVKKGIKLTLCTQTPYAEYIDSAVEPLRGGYALMQGYANFVRNFAKEKGIELIDYNLEVTKIMQSESVYLPDRVHPNALGHKYMAKTFLKAQGIELVETEEFSKEIEEWYAIVQKLRDTMAAEYLTVKDYTLLSDSERIAVVKKNLESEKDEYIKYLLKTHVEEKPNQQKYIEFTKNFMKNK